MMDDFHLAPVVGFGTLVAVPAGSLSRRHGLLGHLKRSEPSVMLLVVPALPFYEVKMSAMARPPLIVVANTPNLRSS